MIDNELMAHILKLRFEQGRTVKSLADEFGVSRNSIGRATKRFREEAEASEAKEKYLADAEELRQLRMKVSELEKENDFLKKAAAFFAKESK